MFQKGFVEFFCAKEDMLLLEKKIASQDSTWVHWFASNCNVRVYLVKDRQSLTCFPRVIYERMLLRVVVTQ